MARRWLGLGATVVVITGSADGADVFTAQGQSVHRPALDVTVVDTVGAGDSFTAGLIGSLLQRGQQAPADLARCAADQLAGALDDAAATSSRCRLMRERSQPKRPARAARDSFLNVSGFCLSV